MRAKVSGFKLQVSSWYRLILYSAFYILSSFQSNAQEIKVKAKFEGDSVKIGTPLAFHLSAHHPAKLNILFPDSSFAYGSFEFQRKIYYPTKTENGISKDSVTYIFTSYEVDSIQTLKLPVFVVNASDCTQMFSNEDTVFFQQLVKSIPASLTPEKLPLKVKLDYLNVSWQLNYFIVGIVTGILLLTLILVWVFFGKKIKKYFRLKKLMKGYEAFLIQFDNSVDKLSNEFSSQKAEQSLTLWKKYLESLLSKPYTKYTSKEIRAVENSDELGVTLAAIDRMIYGNQSDNISPFYKLKEYVHQQFERKKAEVVNG
jgi:hypothetical protein